MLINKIIAKIDIFSYFRRLKTNSFFKRNNLSIKVINFPKKSGLIVATHPTTVDGFFWKKILPSAFRTVDIDNLQIIPKLFFLNEIIALFYSRIIPVYKGKPKREKTFRWISEFLNLNQFVIINPTGQTTFTTNIPNPNSLKLGAIIKALQKNNKLQVCSALIEIEGQIYDSGLISKNSIITIKFSKPINFLILNFDSIKVDINILSKIIVDSWKKLD